MPQHAGVPLDGSLPPAALDELGDTPFSIYIHVPFCARRCGYCDFNTYVAGPDARHTWLTDAHAELELAARVLDEAPPVSTIFFGGGTPTLMRPDELGSLVSHVRDVFGLEAGAEVTSEANPETLDEAYLTGLVAAGITRLSMGMQSADERVLRILERTHSPGRALACVDLAQRVGIEHVSLDLIYGTPGESIESWRHSVEAAINAGPDHLSAYALVVEEGTAMGRRVRSGTLPLVDEDFQAAEYELADELLSGAGFENYEISNWSRGVGARARHNMAYWLGHHWWGIGPGAHSHVGGVRWWNVKLPARYHEALAAGHSPSQGREVLGAETRRLERVLLETRLADGLPVGVLHDSELARAHEVADGGLAVIHGGRFRLTRAGRLLADGIVARILD